MHGAAMNVAVCILGERGRSGERPYQYTAPFSSFTACHGSDTLPEVEDELVLVAAVAVAVAGSVTDTLATPSVTSLVSLSPQPQAFPPAPPALSVASPSSVLLAASAFFLAFSSSFFFLASAFLAALTGSNGAGMGPLSYLWRGGYHQFC